MATPNPPGSPEIPEWERPQARSRASVFLWALGGIAVGAGGTWAIATSKLRAPPPVARAAASAPQVAPSAAASAAPTASGIAARAARGEAQAASELESRAPSERTSEETLALAESRAARKRLLISELGRKLELVPKLGKDKDTVAKLKELAYDREVGNLALAMLAGLKSELGPDLLYVVWTGTPRKTDSTELAEQLLYSKDVRARASKPLVVTLDLRLEENCENMKKVLEQAIEHGDRRSLVPLNRLNNKRGCGEKKLDDCWACLRDTDLVKNALKEVGKRPSGPG